MADLHYCIVAKPALAGLASNPLEGLHKNLAAFGISSEFLIAEDAAKTAELVAKKHRQGHRDFVAAGGDGTVSLLLNAIMPLSTKEDLARLAIWPVGTGNSVMREFPINTPKEWLEAVAQRRGKPIDVGKLLYQSGERYFLNFIGSGQAGIAIKLFDRWFRRFKIAGYSLAAFASILGGNPSYDSQLVTKEGVVLQESHAAILINNSRYIGGNMLVAPKASLDDGLLDITFCPHRSIWKLLCAFKGIFNGHYADFIAQVQSSELAWHCKAMMPLNVDGDYFICRPERIAVAHKALYLIF